MLPSDLVRARRRGERLYLTALKDAERKRASEIAQGLIDVVAESQGATQEELLEGLSIVAREAREEKLWAGLKKLLLDRCEFGSDSPADAPTLRREVFELSATHRRASESSEAFDREEIMTRVGHKFQLSVSELELALYSDLKGAQRLSALPRVTPEALVEAYEHAQLQGVLLKAVKVSVDVHCASPDDYRRLFQKLKFRRLLYRLSPLEKGAYRLEIDGPFSLFESVTKYGLNLALMVPILRACDAFVLEAELRWGKERRSLSFEERYKKDKAVGVLEDPGSELRTEVSTLLDALSKKSASFQVAVSDELLDVPGVGLCVPDLKLSRPGADPVYVEVLGYWSRDAVFRRIEWANSKAGKKVIFCASSRLRVSQELLEEESGSCLYVYKGVISAARILDHAELLLTRA